MSVLESKIQKLIRNERNRLIREQITPWLMGFAAGQFHIRNFHNEEIEYTGIKFEGSPRHVFWSGYIEPFLEDVTDHLISDISQECTEENLGINSELNVLSQHLSNMYTSIFKKMAETDQKILGEGDPNKIPQKSVTAEIALMNRYLEQHINMEVQKKSFRRRIWNASVRNTIISKVIWAILVAIISIFFLSL